MNGDTTVPRSTALHRDRVRAEEAPKVREFDDPSRASLVISGVLFVVVVVGLWMAA